MKKELTLSTFMKTLKDVTMSNKLDDILNTVIGYMRDASELAKIKGTLNHNSVHIDYAGVLDDLANKAHTVLEEHGVYDDVK